MTTPTTTLHEHWTIGTISIFIPIKWNQWNRFRTVKVPIPIHLLFVETLSEWINKVQNPKSSPSMQSTQHSTEHIFLSWKFIVTMLIEILPARSHIHGIRWAGTSATIAATSTQHSSWHKWNADNVRCATKYINSISIGYFSRLLLLRLNSCVVLYDVCRSIANVWVNSQHRCHVCRHIFPDYSEAPGWTDKLCQETRTSARNLKLNIGTKPRG